MQIEWKGTGPWPVATEEDTKITIQVGDVVRTYDCAALQADEQVEIDIVRGMDGDIVEGVANGTEYIANLIIPAAKYEDVPTYEDDPENSMETVRADFAASDMAAVKVVLWSITDNNTDNISEE